MAIDNSVGMFNENAGSVYNAREYRRMFSRMLMAADIRTIGGSASSGTGNGGVARAGDFAVTQRGAGANMSVDVATGGAMVGGTESATQGEYYVHSTATINVAITAADATNPRKDIVGIRVRDSEYSGASNDAVVTVITGTPAASPAEPALPANFLSLALVDVPAADTAITNSQITDRRRRISALGGLVVCTSSTRPATGLWEGQQIYETDTDKTLLYNGSVWVHQTPLGGHVATSQTTTSTSYTDLSTSGPAVTVNTGTSALVTMGCAITSTDASGYTFMSYAVSGATTSSASDARALGMIHSYSGFGYRVSHTYVHTGLTAGANTFTAKYRVSVGTGTFSDRSISVQTL